MFVFAILMHRVKPHFVVVVFENNENFPSYVLCCNVLPSVCIRVMQ